MKALFYTLEILIGYGPIVLLWLLGVGMGIPYGIVLLVGGDILGIGILASVALGGIGLWGLLRLIEKLFWPKSEFSIKNYRIHLLCGVIAVIITGAGYIINSKIISLFLLLPIIVTAHFYYVCAKGI